MIYFEGIIFSLKIKNLQESDRRTKGKRDGRHIKDMGVLFISKKYGFSLFLNHTTCLICFLFSFLIDTETEKDSTVINCS